MLSPTRPAAELRRVAGLQLRGTGGRVPGRVWWPASDPAEHPPALLLLFHERDADVTALCEGLCRETGAVVLAAGARHPDDAPDPAVFSDARAVLEWAADHAADLDADPRRLLVAGAGPGAALAGGVAMHARDDWWPAIERQLLIHPALDAWPSSVPYVSALRSAPLEGLAPATIVSGTAVRTSGARYAARLRAAGVPVELLAHDADGGDPLPLAAVAATMRTP